MTRITHRALSALTATALLAGLLVGTPSAARALGGTIYVGTGSNDSGGSCAHPNYGASTTDARDAIQSAIEDAGNDRAVYLCAGTYLLNGTVAIDKSVTLQGAGAESVTISPDNFEGTLLMVEVSATIENITIDGASKNWGVGDGNGAAILGWERVTLTVNDSVFTNNQAGQGAAIWMDNLSALITHNNLFKGNVAQKGDCIRCGGGDGGAISIGSDASGNLYGDSFINNHATGSNDWQPSGGAIRSNGAELHVDGATFNGNTSVEDGGAIWVRTGSVEVIDSTFINNHAVGATFTTEGGALYMDIGDVTVIGSTFTGNSSYEDGGAIAMDDAEHGALILRDNVFTSNMAQGDPGADGGAVYFVAESTEMTNNTFSRNQAGRDGGAAYGGWIQEDSYTNDFLVIAVQINGNSFSSNRAKTYGGALAIESQAKPGDALRNRFSANRSRYGVDVAELGGGSGCPVSRGDTMRAWRRSGARTIVAACVSY